MSSEHKKASSSQILSTQHSDYILDVEFDVYGRRMATCSGDRTVRVWDLLGDGSWQLSGDWQAHRSAVTSISWSHPEFGTLLATSGADHDVKLWEERLGGGDGIGGPNASSSAAGGSLPSTVGPPAAGAATGAVWSQKAQLAEARRAVNCCEFAPRHLGLLLATGSADGMLRIYEAVDVLNLSQWPLQGSVPVFSHDPGVTTLSWCTGRFEQPTLAVGGSHVVLYRYESSTRQWQSLLSFPPQGQVTCVSWAPNVGRRFHWIATTENQRLRVYELARGSNKLELVSSSNQVLDEETTVWKCQWNVTGTVLASSGDDGLVQLWKPDFSHKSWSCVSEIHGDLNDASSPTPTSHAEAEAAVMMT